ncbi:Serine/threonine-protein kinase PrkC [Maioricimonas rarisocia]|uniref:Serine/threonine-protein kinase PrkC n=1 Tax=Maioricimonas rarisocia TaxID=2528026 RepID=A0A517ZAP4_9PLAN|nr:serine/threonine-protein kinase [Maioricimonas rarisocia]QDU39499.1 Serine/threonine-protein kinase PrkC [Maioricimonas rarisocia]
MLSPGQTLLSFEILGPLGAGGMGEVYRARDTMLGREVALKLLPAAVASDETLRHRLSREAHTLASLNHPHVAQIYGFHESSGEFFLSLELVGGEDLSARLERGPLSVDDALTLSTQIADGLAAAHRAGVVHRDLKPSNIRITSEGRIKILDFGLAKLVSPAAATVPLLDSAATVIAPLTRLGVLLGTPPYMSPEQTRGLATDRRTDIWAFGCVLYECLTGRPAFDGPSLADVIAAVLDRDPDWDALPSETPASVVSLLHSCLTRDVDQRLGDLDAATVQRAIADDSVATLPASAPLRRARAACAARDWSTAYDVLTEADRNGSLNPEGLELLAECARWQGRHESVFDPLERAHAIYVGREDGRGAVRTALALCYANDDAGRDAVAKAWLGRADEFIARSSEGPEHALHAWFHNRVHGAAGDLDKQKECATRALDLARRSGDRNVEALALIDLAHVATVQANGKEALGLIEQATSLAIGGEIDIFATGIVFCNAIWACRCRGEWQRAQEWTDSATRWVSRQQVDYFPGMCRVHRAEVLRIRGNLAAAEQECEAATRQVERALPAYATFPWAELGEVRRRRGNLTGAMAAFEKAMSLGWDPQPGLALLLLQQGDAASAHAAIERTFSEPRPTMLHEDRANLLCARANIASAVGNLPVAETAVADLEEMAERNESRWDEAAAAHARGMFEFRTGQPAAAVEHLAKARRLWLQLDTPYELATTGLLLGRALDADGDRHRARLELKAAREVFSRVGAILDVEQADELLSSLDESRPAGAAPKPSAPAASMIREGESWVISFGGRQVRLPSTRGLEYLATLLSQPDVECWAIDLASPGGTVDRGDAGEVLDATARQEYRRRVEELQQELAEIDSRTDPVRAESLRSELDTIARQLAAAVGLGGRSRRTGSAVERARQSVTKGIRGAIRKIAAEHPSLGRYLEVTIRTGTACRFEPDRREPVRWVVARST